MKKPLDNLINRVFGKWKVLNQYKNNQGRIVCLCECNCGKVKEVKHGNLTNGYSTQCSRCANPGFAFKHSRWKGCGDLTGRHWREIIWNATQRGNRRFEFAITIEYAWDLFTKQRGLCALTGLFLRFKANYKDLEPQTASLDRIDSQKGYIEGNVQWIHKDVNKMKNNFSQERFLEICELCTKNKAN